MVLVQKWPFFQLFPFRQYRQENVFYDILQRKNASLGYKIMKFKYSKNWHFFKGVNPWFWPKNGHFCNFFFLGNIGQENVFYDILQRKNAFLGYKTRSSNSRKIDIFSKGLTHGFGPIMALFLNFFSGNIRQENVFYDILERINAFFSV